jgi:prolipoprotein diacylglyceryl transferase
MIAFQHFVNLLNEFLVIPWNVSPEIFSIGPITLRWYGVLFAAGFFFGQGIMAKIFAFEHKSEEDFEKLLLTMILAVVIGARLGHCLFYNPEYYLSNPLRILKVWEGGLASHGGGIGIFVALYLYTRKRADQSYLWVLDRIAITIALGGALIRFGNLMNSEIVGSPTDVPWAFLFYRLNETPVIPRHPAQLYESLSIFLLFIYLYTTYWRKKGQIPEGRFFGIFLIYVFVLRFLYEFIKRNQEAFEDDMILNMGQILSIPMVIFGIISLIYSFGPGKRAMEEKIAKYGAPSAPVAKPMKLKKEKAK